MCHDLIFEDAFYEFHLERVFFVKYKICMMKMVSILLTEAQK